MFGILGFFIGILLGAFGLFMVVFFPNTQEHQAESFTVAGIVIGIISLVIGFLLIFF
jgi:hypothetical protein